MAADASFDCVEGLLNRSQKAAFPVEGRGFRTPGHLVIGHSIQIAAATTSKHGAPYVIAVAMVLCGRAKDGQPCHLWPVSLAQNAIALSGLISPTATGSEHSSPSSADSASRTSPVDMTRR